MLFPGETAFFFENFLYLISDARKKIVRRKLKLCKEKSAKSTNIIKTSIVNTIEKVSFTLFFANFNPLTAIP